MYLYNPVVTNPFFFILTLAICITPHRNKIKPSVNKSTIEVYKKVEENYLKSAKAAVPVENSYLG